MIRIHLVPEDSVRPILWVDVLRVREVEFDSKSPCHSGQEPDESHMVVPLLLMDYDGTLERHKGQTVGRFT